MDVSEGIGGSETRDFLESVWHEEEIRLTEARKIFLPNPLVQLKTYPEDFCRKMRESGKYLSELLAIMECAAEPGISPSDLENIARAFFYRHESAGILPAFPGTDGYPHAISVSKNDGIFHLPIDDVPFRNGDIVTIDSGVRWH